jgi:hypothetical protein
VDVEPQKTWIVKVEMTDPQVIREVPSTGAASYEEEDVEQMHRRLRDGLPLDSPRRLANAAIQNGVLIAFFETSTEPSQAECQEFYRLTVGALSPFRRPRKFNCVKTYPVSITDVGYLL